MTLGEALKVPGLNVADFQTGTKGMFERYTPGMQQVKRAYKKQFGIDNNTLYLFFLDLPGIDKDGFMPLTGNYGFIFNFEIANIHTIAHELGQFVNT